MVAAVLVNVLVRCEGKGVSTIKQDFLGSCKPWLVPGTGRIDFWLYLNDELLMWADEQEVGNVFAQISKVHEERLMGMGSLESS